MTAIVVVGALCGCDQLLDLIDQLDDQSTADPPRAETPAPVEDEQLPQRPENSIARSETEVITFRNILENEEMSREERIQALLNLDPAALQAPKGGASPPQRAEPQARQDEGPKDWEIANARKRVPVVMYSTAWCGVCTKARRYFEKKRISFVEYDVDKNASARAEYLQLNPRRTVPTIKIGNEVIVGFSEQAVGRALDDAARAQLN
jgi:glutaredoxin